MVWNFFWRIGFIKVNEWYQSYNTGLWLVSFEISRLWLVSFEIRRLWVLCRTLDLIEDLISWKFPSSRRNQLTFQWINIYFCFYSVQQEKVEGKNLSATDLGGQKKTLRAELRWMNVWVLCHCNSGRIPIELFSTFELSVPRILTKWDLCLAEF